MFSIPLLTINIIPSRFELMTVL